MNLWDYLDAKKEIERLTRLIEELTTKIEGLGMDYTQVKVKTTPKNDKIGEVIDNLIKLKEQTELEKERQAKAMAEIVDAINSVEDPRQKDILQMRYIEGQSWDYIGQTLGFNWRHLIREHNKALNNMRGEE